MTMTLVRDFFIGLSQNQILNSAAKQYGLKLGAQHVVAGTNVAETMESIKKLNAQGISCTVDNLGEFVYEKDEALTAKRNILDVIEAIHAHKVDAHISLKPSQLGLDIDYDFCVTNLKEIVATAKRYDIFVNFDMEDHARLQPSMDILQSLSADYDNIGTVIQAYFYRASEDIERLKDFRVRIVKGAYKEPVEVAYQDKKDIDDNFIKLIEWHLLNGKFTSIATHDHNVIDHVKAFVKEHQIANDKFEFQMLYGFRTDLQLELVKEGYAECTYVPFGSDWYGYFMRRLAERPQNINLIAKQAFNKKTKTMIGLAVGAFMVGRFTKRK